MYFINKFVVGEKVPFETKGRQDYVCVPRFWPPLQVGVDRTDPPYRPGARVPGLRVRPGRAPPHERSLSRVSRVADLHWWYTLVFFLPVRDDTFRRSTLWNRLSKVFSRVFQHLFSEFGRSFVIIWSYWHQKNFLNNLFLKDLTAIFWISKFSRFVKKIFLIRFQC